ncbi:neuromedin Ba isoform X1 [Cyprinus carpio]|uniref:Neuromedin Ba isoform X1 n=1 Tax=Cyprinus carpio TaxID=7962 RepID=A0A9Q9XDM6_CYPCA|nr:neuromedin Ba isoform X1 [Cyprinus carpio]
MAVSSEDGHCRYRLFAFIMLFNVSLSAAVSLDLTELRNKVSKIKVHPRGNLWATGMFSFNRHAIRIKLLNQFPVIIVGLLAGHFMGKKSISNSQFQDSPFSSKPPRNTLRESGSAEDLRELITQEVLRAALQAQLQDLKRTQDVYNQETDFMVKLLKSYIEKRNL